MSFTPLPDPPSRADPANFNDRADALFEALPIFVQEANTLIPGETAAGLAQFLASAESDRGDALITVKRSDIASAVSMTLHDWHQADRVNVRQVGVKGDGVTDDAPLLNTLGALGIPLFIPHTATGYKINSTVTFACNVWCEGFFIPDASIGSAANDYNRFAIVLATSGYADKRVYAGLRVQGSVALRTARVNGIRCDSANTRLDRCQAFQLDRGIVVRNYSIVVNQCAAWQCNTNLSAYARNSATEINALTIFGGNYDSAVNAGIIIGDTSWSDAMTTPAVSHGVLISIIAGVNCDGAPMKIDRVVNVHIRNYYCEGAGSSDCAILLGGAGDGYLRNVDIDNSFFKNVRYAIKCASAVNGLEVGRNFYTGVLSSALYITSDLYHFSYIIGDATASFTEGHEVHTGFRFLAAASISFVNATIPHLGLHRGVQTVSQDVGEWFPAGVLRSGVTTKTDVSGTTLRRYTTPMTGTGGTVAAGGIFTCTIAAHAANYNGGDNVVLSLGGATFVRYVDYAAGIVYLDGATTTGAATLSQVQATQRTESRGTAAPTSGSWLRGDRVVNSVPTVGQPKAWACTLAGTPGTWVSEGNL